jgi:hypothetical protein
MIAGLAWMLGCGVIAGGLAVLADAASIAPYVAGAGALGYFISTIAAMIPQQVTLDVSPTVVTTSWRGAIEIATPPQLGTWVVAGIDAPMGLVLRVGSLRIGGEGHDGAGYEVRGAPTRTVDCHLGKADFEALCVAIGIRKGELGPVVVPLVRSSQSAGGAVRMMAPWLLTMAGVSTLGVIAGETGVMETRDGRIALVAITVAIVVAGIAVMVVRGRRVRAPELELRVEADALVLARAGGDVIVRAPWATVTIERRRFTQSSRAGSYAMPLLVLTLEGHEPLRLGAWDTRLAWPDGPEKAWRGPKWLAGAAVWPRLIEALRAHGRL